LSMTEIEKLTTHPIQNDLLTAMLQTKYFHT